MWGSEGLQKAEVKGGTEGGGRGYTQEDGPEGGVPATIQRVEAMAIRNKTRGNTHDNTIAVKPMLYATRGSRGSNTVDNPARRQRLYTTRRPRRGSTSDYTEGGNRRYAQQGYPEGGVTVDNLVRKQWIYNEA